MNNKCDFDVLDMLSQHIQMQYEINSHVLGANWKSGADENGTKINWRNALAVEAYEIRNILNTWKGKRTPVNTGFLPDSFRYARHTVDGYDEYRVVKHVALVWYYMLCEGTANGVFDSENIDIAHMHFLTWESEFRKGITAPVDAVDSFMRRVLSKECSFYDIAYSFMLMLASFDITFEKLNERFIRYFILVLFRYDMIKEHGEYNVTWCGMIDTSHVDSYIRKSYPVSFEEMYNYLSTIYKDFWFKGGVETFVTYAPVHH